MSAAAAIAAEEPVILRSIPRENRREKTAIEAEAGAGVEPVSPPDWSVHASETTTNGMIGFFVSIIENMTLKMSELKNSYIRERKRAEKLDRQVVVFEMLFRQYLKNDNSLKYNSGVNWDELVRNFTHAAASEMNLDDVSAHEFRSRLEKVLTAEKRQLEIATLPDRPVRDYDWRKDEKDVISYIRSDEGFKRWVELDALSRPLLHRVAPKAYTALANYMKKNDLPSDIRIPTKSQLVDSVLEIYSNNKDLLNAYEAHRKRLSAHPK